MDLPFETFVLIDPRSISKASVMRARNVPGQPSSFSFKIYGQQYSVSKLLESNSVKSNRIEGHSSFIDFVYFNRTTWISFQKAIIVIKEILSQIMQRQAAKILAELKEVTAVAELDGFSWCINI